ncbi:MAG TPA: o-succinylbenzoate synthase [Balneola sp.]|jgi:L-Ala-D/L-Glu epimerase|nr:o-succinylbenzoate synthase [Balneola sp.]MAO76605.1 o-succinylbenzoate synthase [Balneola sp.]MBF63725.1 o-succinylbenzoate synthase [Balneola sp.]HAH51923.1 o-succinylbenzoate synthase [Balneola sp.]HBZ40113.1 o-succinylbenzoate synthase [Balneola sp.]|tara:strand:- start:6726 stop:7799 length:1074 start_codon:yes stop_codon:yes gene_type:complete
MLKYYSYRIPFRNPFKISGANYEFREGIILEFEHEGIKAVGEIAPLPGFSVNTLDQVLSVLQLNKKPLENAMVKGEFPQFFYVLTQIHDIPSLKFGLDTLYHDYQSKRKGISLIEFLFPNHTDKVVVSNAVLGITDLETTVSNANKLIKDGFNTIKVKVGSDFEKEFKILTALRTNYPSLRIRIDANQSWTFNEAVSNLKKIETLNIEYCEEPLLPDDLHQISLLKKKVKIKLAADESIGNKKTNIPLSMQNEFDVFVLKPSMIGSFSEIYVTKQLADSHYTDIVFTTSLETKIGRTVTAILATGWGANNYAHGLATGSLLSFDLNDQTEIELGTYVIPQKPGLGIDLNYNYLKEII